MIAVTLSTIEARIYSRARADGLSPVAAFDSVRARRVLTWDDGIEGDAPYPHGLLDAYMVDGDALARYSTVRLPVGATASLYVYRDDDSTPDDVDVYSPEDIEAWTLDAWEYVGIVALVVLPNGDHGESALWSFERGDHWPGSDVGQLWHAVPDVIGDALAQAVRRAEHDMTCGACGRTWSSVETPTPAARCPFEAEHEDDEDDESPWDPMTLYDDEDDDEAATADSDALHAIRAALVDHYGDEGNLQDFGGFPARVDAILKETGR